MSQAPASASPKTNIVLIGMPGSGKSTLAQALSARTGMPYLDADHIIEAECNQPLQALVDANGPQGFIELENRILSRLEPQHSIISTGGSAIYGEDAMRHLAEVGTVVYLQASYETLHERLGDFSNRGVVMKDGRGMGLRAIYDERLPLYERYAQLVVDVNEISVEEAEEKLASVLGL
jgi:shikimate kinase